MDKRGYDQKAQAGRGNMMKTGKGIPMKFYGPQMAEDGPGDGIVDNIRSAARAVGQRISTAHQRGMKKYKKNWSAGSTLGDFGSSSGGRGGSRTYDPTNYVSGFVGGLIDGKPQPKGGR